MSVVWVWENFIKIFWNWGKNRNLVGWSWIKVLVVEWIWIGAAKKKKKKSHARLNLYRHKNKSCQFSGNFPATNKHCLSTPVMLYLWYFWFFQGQITGLKPSTEYTISLATVSGFGANEVLSTTIDITKTTCKLWLVAYDSFYFVLIYISRIIC